MCKLDNCCNLGSVEKADIDQFAGLLLDAYGETAAYARTFVAQYDWPPTALAKAQHFRSIVQSRIVQDPRYALAPTYVALGRVGFTDSWLGRRLVIRSEKALELDHLDAEPTLDLQVKRKVSGTQLLVYRFSGAGLTLSWCESYSLARGARLRAVGTPTRLGLWPYGSGSANGDGPTFDQGGSTNWDAAGDVGDEDSGSGEE